MGCAPIAAWMILAADKPEHAPIDKRKATKAAENDKRKRDTKPSDDKSGWVKMRGK